MQVAMTVKQSAEASIQSTPRMLAESAGRGGERHARVVVRARMRGASTR